MKQKLYNCNKCHTSWSKPTDHCPHCHSTDFGLYDYGICNKCNSGDFIKDRPLYNDLCPDCFRKSIGNDTIRRYMLDAENGRTPISQEQIIKKVFFSSDDTHFQRFLWNALRNFIFSHTDEDYNYYMTKLYNCILENLDEFYDWYKEVN